MREMQEDAGTLLRWTPVRAGRWRRPGQDAAGGVLAVDLTRVSLRTTSSWQKRASSNPANSRSKSSPQGGADLTGRDDALPASAARPPALQSAINSSSKSSSKWDAASAASAPAQQSAANSPSKSSPAGDADPPASTSALAATAAPAPFPPPAFPRVTLPDAAHVPLPGDLPIRSPSDARPLVLRTGTRPSLPREWPLPRERSGRPRHPDVDVSRRTWLLDAGTNPGNGGFRSAKDPFS